MASPLTTSLIVLTAGASLAGAVQCTVRDPFKVLDPQKWVNPDDMVWADFKHPPGTNWSDPTQSGWSRNFNIALVTVDYDDEPFIITQAPGSTIFGNPQPNAPSVAREQVPAFYRDLLNTPNELNGGHTLHEYWMGDSFGKFGVNLTAFGPYRLPSKSFQYGIDTTGFNPNACPQGYTCNINLRTDALGAWRREVGNTTAASFELVFILSAGQDESSTWQEFGEMRFNSKEDVTEAFGAPPGVSGNDTLPNYAKTRYVEWTSWASASTIWPNAGGGSSTQGESSGMATYAHELSHLLGIGDNYNNPYGVPLRRAYTGPFSMLDRGSFNGPGGPHKRWLIPATQGGSMGSLHTMRDKFQIGLISNSSMLQLSREKLPKSGLVVAELTARAVDHGDAGLMGIRVRMSGDLAPACNINTDVLCDGRGYNNYELEVVDRMGADSFAPDHGVMISKTKTVDSQPFQWVIDANPQDISLVDFIRPNGSAAMITMGDYRQLADALFHAGTRSGSEFEFQDTANRLHFYVIDIRRDSDGVLYYTVAVRSVDGTGGASKHGVTLGPGSPDAGQPTGKGASCWFQLNNTGEYVASGANHPNDATAYLQSDVYRLSAKVEGEGWRTELQNALVTVGFGAGKSVNVAVGAEADAAASAIVTLTATSESDGSVVSSAECVVFKTRQNPASVELK